MDLQLKSKINFINYPNIGIQKFIRFEEDNILCFLDKNDKMTALKIGIEELGFIPERLIFKNRLFTKIQLNQN